MRRTALALVAAAVLSCAGCQYYRVTDPASGREYVAHESIFFRASQGGVQFRDVTTGDAITLQSNEVRVISEDEARAAILKKETMGKK